MVLRLHKPICGYLWFWMCCIHITFEKEVPQERSENSRNISWDPNGYIFYCPCHGRFGNQADQFLGTLAFAKQLDRTLILPPWRAYDGMERMIPFDRIFQVEPLKLFHRVILAADFMNSLAPIHWNSSQRVAFCHHVESEKPCAVDGEFFLEFWNFVGVTKFVGSVNIKGLGFHERDSDDWKRRIRSTLSKDPGDGLHQRQLFKPWSALYEYSTAVERYLPEIIEDLKVCLTATVDKKFTSDNFPVISLRGPPAAFPVPLKHWPLQKYVRWSTTISDIAERDLISSFHNDPFLGIHLRNGADWEKACNLLEDERHGLKNLMASTQCLGEHPEHAVTMEMCLPTLSQVLDAVAKILERYKLKHIYISTDANPYSSEIRARFEGVTVVTLVHKIPQVDLYILEKSDVFLGNCVSSFTSFVRRSRDILGRQTFYFGMLFNSLNDEL